MSALNQVKGLAVLRLLVLLIGTVPGIGHAQKATPWTKPLTQQALASGYDAKLPPHISMVLGIAQNGESVLVRQLMGRVEQTVHTYNVSVANHADVVLFLADERAQSTAVYLLSAGGKLRKAVTYHAGGEPQELTADDARRGLARERSYWAKYAAGSGGGPAPTRPSP